MHTRAAPCRAGTGEGEGASGPQLWEPNPNLTPGHSSLAYSFLPLARKGSKVQGLARKQLPPPFPASQSGSSRGRRQAGAPELRARPLADRRRRLSAATPFALRHPWGTCPAQSSVPSEPSTDGRGVGRARATHYPPHWRPVIIWGEGVDPFQGSQGGPGSSPEESQWPSLLGLLPALLPSRRAS